MHVLVTGGTGFIGRALCDELRAQGLRVTVLTRRPDEAARLLSPDIDVTGELGAIAEPPDAVVNLAGANLGARRWNASRKQAFVDSRVGTTRRLVEWFATLPRPPAVMVSGSAVGYYGARGDATLTEEAPPAAEYQSEMCRLWEEEARTAEKLGVRVCRIRTGIVLGPNGGALEKMLPPFRLGLGGHLGRGGQWMSWIHRADLVALILWCLTNPQARGAYNGTAPNPATNREFSRALGRALHRPALLPVPAPAVRLMIGEMAHLLLTGQKVLPARALKEGFEFRFAELDAALRDVLSG